MEDLHEADLVVGPLVAGVQQQVSALVEQAMARKVRERTRSSGEAQYFEAVAFLPVVEQMAVSLEQERSGLMVGRQMMEGYTAMVHVVLVLVLEEQNRWVVIEQVNSPLGLVHRG